MYTRKRPYTILSAAQQRPSPATSASAAWQVGKWLPLACCLWLGLAQPVVGGAMAQPSSPSAEDNLEPLWSENTGSAKQAQPSPTEGQTTVTKDFSCEAVQAAGLSDQEASEEQKSAVDLEGTDQELHSAYKQQVIDEVGSHLATARKAHQEVECNYKKVKQAYKITQKLGSAIKQPYEQCTAAYKEFAPKMGCICQSLQAQLAQLQKEQILEVASYKRHVQAAALAGKKAIEHKQAVLQVFVPFLKQGLAYLKATRPPGRKDDLPSSEEEPQELPAVLERADPAASDGSGPAADFL